MNKFSWETAGNNDLCSLKLLNRLCEAEKYFTEDVYLSTVTHARELFEYGDLDLCEKELEKLPSSDQLLDGLVKKLEGKSVYRTLKKILEGKAENNLVTAKGLSSLLTHVLIECEKGNNRYKVLIPKITEKLNEIIYNALQ